MKQRKSGWWGGGYVYCHHTNDNGERISGERSIINKSKREHKHQSSIMETGNDQQRHEPSQSSSAAAAASSSSSSSNSNNDTNINYTSIIRYNQLRDMSNHQLCSDVNRKALFIEKMNEMSSKLLQEIRDTDWMFEKKDNGSGNIYYNHDGEEPVLSMKKGIYDEKF